jgi:hypothetical protein
MELNIPKTYQNVLYFLLMSAIFTYANSLLSSDKAIENMLLEKYSAEQVKKTLHTIEILQYFLPLISTLFFLLGCLFISLCIRIGLFYLNINKDFGQILQTVSLCNLIFLLPKIIGIFFSIYNANLPINEKNSFPSFSIFSLIDKSKIDSILVIPLDYLNVFEFCFWILLAYFIGKMIQYSFFKSLKFVSLTYGLGLSVWIVLQCYLTVLND